MFDKIRRRGFALDPSCKLWMPCYRYGSEQAKIWDQSGNQKHGTISGAVHVVPSGWYFDGLNDRVVHPSMNLGKLHTLHYWIKRIGDDSGMVHAGAVDYNGLRISDTTVGYSSGAGTAAAETHNGAASTAIKTLISVIRILDKVTFYQNGVQIGVEQIMGGQPDDLTLTDIGRYSDGTSYFNGVVYEATVFSDNKGFIGVRNFFEMTRQIQGI